jgi:hypothetical protein
VDEGRNSAFIAEVGTPREGKGEKEKGERGCAAVACCVALALEVSSSLCVDAAAGWTRLRPRFRKDGVVVSTRAFPPPPPPPLLLVLAR